MLNDAMRDQMADYFERAIKTGLERLRRALARGVETPVVVRLEIRSKFASNAYRERYRRKPVADPGFGGKHAAAFRAWTVPEATDLMRRYGMVPGRALANVLEDWSAGWWWLDWGQVSMTLVGCHRGDTRGEQCFVGGGFISDEVFPGMPHYDSRPGWRPMRPRAKAGPEIRLKRTEIRRAGDVLVCGLARREAAAAAYLVDVVDARAVAACPLPIGPQWLPLRDDDLACLLDAKYRRAPRAVAEAVRALRRVPGKREAWLLAVLQTDPRLGGLWKAVRAELGEAELDAADTARR